MDQKEKALRDDLARVAQKQARREASIIEIEEEIEQLKAQYDEKLTQLVQYISSRGEAASHDDAAYDGKALPDEIQKLRGKTGQAVRLIYSQPDEVWTFDELHQHFPTFSSVNSLNTSLSLMVNRGLLVKEPRVGFRAHPKLVRKMRA